MPRSAFESTPDGPELRDFRATRKQRIALVSVYYVQELSPYNAVWTHDLSDWQDRLDPETALPQPTVLVILNRFEERGFVTPLWEQFNTVVRRPPRKYHRLTELGAEVAVHHLQELRADPGRPSWVLIPELSGGQYIPQTPEDFAVTPPEGELVLETGE